MLILKHRRALMAGWREKMRGRSIDWLLSREDFWYFDNKKLIHLIIISLSMNFAFLCFLYIFLKHKAEIFVLNLYLKYSMSSQDFPQFWLSLSQKRKKKNYRILPNKKLQNNINRNELFYTEKWQGDERS